MVTAILLAGVLGVVALTATGPSASSAPQPAGSSRPPPETPVAAPDEEHANSIVVFGDSISARYNDLSGDELQGFWSMVADEVGAEPQVRAQGGAGYVNPGLVGCTGLTFGGQLALPDVSRAVVSAGVVIVEGGRTDTQTCRRGGGYDLVPTAQLRRAVEALLTEVERLRGANDACTLVVVPWGPKGPENRDRITRVVANATARHGFTFVDTLGLLTEDLTIEDRVHPTRKGSRVLARAILDRSPVRACFFRARLASLGTRHGGSVA